MPDGIVVIDKPQDWTSMDVCARLRGIFHEKRVGHAGTLDPMATGVLPVFVGQATKAVPFAEGGWKEYVASLRLGLVTDTQDVWGTALRAALARFTGEIEQIPPMYSAVKIGGKKLYELARAGQEVARKPRRVTIREAELLGRDAAGDWTLRVVCSKGTVLMRLMLDRAASVDEAVTLEQVQSRGAEALRPTDSLFRRYPAYRIADAETERRCRCGNPICAQLAPGTYRVYGADGTFLALSEAKDGVLTAKRNFFST